MKTTANRKETRTVLHVNENISLEEQIAIRAYELWRQRSCGDGSDLHDWFQAEREINEWHQKKNEGK